jgi:hypothetical protein
MNEYINHDLDLNKFFADRQHCVVPYPSKHDYAINRQIYFRPSNSPIIWVEDADLGSCFEDLIVPTGSWIYKDNGTREHVPSNVDLHSHIEQIHQNIDGSIAKIYQQHSQVNLLYSGGIDCMVVLSYILKQGLARRTRLICFENNTQPAANGLATNTAKKQKVVDLYRHYQDQLLGIDWHTINVEDVVNVFNHGDLAAIKCYATRTILDRYLNQAFIGGHHGNLVLLHKWIYLDEIVIQNSQMRQLMQQHQKEKTSYYTTSLSPESAGNDAEFHYQIPDSPMGLDRRHLLMKPWDALCGHNGNWLYTPLGSDQNFTLTRRLNFAQIDPWTIMNATVARDLIMLNVGHELDAFIDTESVKENDNLELIQLPADLLNLKQLTVPMDLKHHKEGLDYIQYEIAQIPQRGWLAINTAVSIKSLWHISNTFK